MTREEAIEKVERSIAQGVQLITPKGKSYEAHIKEVVDTLMAHIIDPQQATITSASFPEYAFEKYKKSKVWAIAQMNGSWLLTLDGENEFALGFGGSPTDIMMHGFSSSDAVGEWCA